MAQGLRIAMYHVEDLDQAKIWYSKVLGKDPYFDMPFYVGFNVGGFELALKPAEERQEKGASTYTYWAVDDAHAEYQRLQALGATAHGDVMDVGENILVATVKDPWNNVYGIVQNPNFALADA